MEIVLDACTHFAFSTERSGNQTNCYQLVGYIIESYHSAICAVQS